VADKKRGKKVNRKVVLASGVFDLLHLGHVRFLEEAKKTGGPNSVLVVIIARDSTVKSRKGEKSIMPENQRCALVASLRVVDEAILGYEKFDIARVVEKICPDVVAFGYDQKEMERTVREYVKQHGLRIKVVRIGKFSSDGLDSSSKIKQRIIEDYGS
jgi:FAD synthetase